MNLRAFSSFEQTFVVTIDHERRALAQRKIGECFDDHFWTDAQWITHAYANDWSVHLISIMEFGSLRHSHTMATSVSSKRTQPSDLS